MLMLLLQTIYILNAFSSLTALKGLYISMNEFDIFTKAYNNHVEILKNTITYL